MCVSQREKERESVRVCVSEREREKTCPKSFGNLAEEIFFFVFLHETDFGNETGFFCRWCKSWLRVFDRKLKS